MCGTCGGGGSAAAVSPDGTGSAKRCTNKHCGSPHKSSKFYQIKEGQSAGGQDWSSVVGQVLCNACYQRFERAGTLERRNNKPLEEEQRRCTNEHCHSPTHGSKFYQIQEGKSTGGRDWTSVVGQVLCHACHERFRRGGTLERRNNKAGQRSTIPSMMNFWLSSFFSGWCGSGAIIRHRVLWVGKAHPVRTIVARMGINFMPAREVKREVVEGPGGITVKSLTQNLLAWLNPRCEFEGCSNPDKSHRFYTIGDDNWACGQDWGPLKGKVLCKACYKYYSKTGNLKRKQLRKRKGRGPAEDDVEPQGNGEPLMRTAGKKGKLETGGRDVPGPSAAGPAGHDQATDTQDVPPGGIKT